MFLSKIIFYVREVSAQLTEKFAKILMFPGKTSKKLQRKHLVSGCVYHTVGGLYYVDETIEQLKLISELWEKGTYKTVIDRVYYFEQIFDPPKYLDTGRKKEI